MQNLFGLDNTLQIPSIPYMGNKRKLATRIINRIIDVNGDGFDHLYDLFGGGGSISIAALNLWGKTIHYNEYNTAICNLMKHIQSGGDIPYDWITREQFFEALNKTDWYSGMIQSCWSFGNKQSSYLYGKDIEDLKHLAHKVCVDKDLIALEGLEKNIGYKLNLDLTQGIHQIRIQMKNQCEQLKLIENLQRNVHLERLQHLQALQALQITNKSYEDVNIQKNSVIYCDPPYKGTGEYQKGNFDHDRFYDWALSNPNPVFISEYSMPSDFRLVDSFHHKSTLSSTNNNKVVIENLYSNK